MKMQSGRPLFAPSPEAKRYLSSMRWLQTRKVAFRVAYWLAILFCVVGLAVLLLPWQQNSRGVGRVIALNPLERQQTLGAPIKGRVVEWYVTEGSFVKKGQLIARMADNDPKALERIQQQRQAAQEQLQLLNEQVDAYKNKIKSLKRTREMHLRANSLKIKMTWQKLRALQQKERALKASLRTATINYKRKKRLHKDSIVSNRSLEVAELKVAKLRAALSGLQAEVVSARADIVANKASRLKESAKDQSKIDSARADYQTAKNKVAYIKRDIAKLGVKLARQEAQVIRATRDTVVLRFLVTQDSEMLKQGDPIALLVPRVNSMAVEIWINGNDVPLVTVGRHVRLQFEGWPAVQFTGWPSVAVGTFGGVVKLVDVASSTNGKFRVVVTPDPKDDPWPKTPYLRQGMRVKGWILLNQVQLWYEIWRQLNGFPPSFDKPLEPVSNTAKKRSKK